MSSFTTVLVGKPNSGKTSIFNALTGARQKVANYPGVTVEKKQGHLKSKKHGSIEVIDLPGIYNLTPQTEDEQITCNVLAHRVPGIARPDMIILVADATSPTVSIRQAIELKQFNIPMVMVMNMSDLSVSQGYNYDTKTLSTLLDLPVIEASAIKTLGIAELKAHLDERLGTHTKEPDTAQKAPETDYREICIKARQILDQVTIKRGTSSATTRKIDAVLLHPFLGFVFLFALLFVLFQSVFSLSEAPMGWIDSTFIALQELVVTHIPQGALQSLLADGIIAGVGSVIIFLPQILILFFLIFLLEDSGYMARAVLILDRYMHAIGLSGKSFIPILSGFACAIPAIMATRTIRNRHSRLFTIFTIPLTSCSARLPVYTLIIAAFVPNQEILGLFNLQGLVLFGLYSLGIITALVIVFLGKMFLKLGQEESLMIELPSYKLPIFKNIILGLYERGRIFVVNAGTIIFALMVILWFLSSYPVPAEDYQEPPIKYSFAGRIGTTLEPVFEPIGFNWQTTIALIPGFAAREVVVGALATTYALSDVDEDNPTSLIQKLQEHWTLPTALSFLIWYVFAPQCFATLGVIRREVGSGRMTLAVFICYLLLAYAASLFTYWITGTVLGV
jgi:ferrous iron transport protein B